MSECEHGNRSHNCPECYITELEAKLDKLEEEHIVLVKVANIAHHGGLLGFKDMYDAHGAITKLTAPYWDKDKYTQLQRNR